MEWNMWKYLFPSNRKENTKLFSDQAHVTLVTFKLPLSFLFTASFTAASNWFKQKYQNPLPVLYEHYNACYMNVNNKDGTFSM
jgi:hypothetical protein